MTIGSLTSSQQITAVKEGFASKDIRTRIAKGVDVNRVTDEAHFADDLGADCSNVWN
jgi:hypothetical protein